MEWVHEGSPLRSGRCEVIDSIHRAADRQIPAGL